MVLRHGVGDGADVEGVDQVLVRVDRMDAAHHPIAATVQLVTDGGRGEGVVGIASGVLELCILCGSIAIRPAIAELVFECDQETRLRRGGHIGAVTVQLVAHCKGRDEGGGEGGGS